MSYSLFIKNKIKKEKFEQLPLYIDEYPEYFKDKQEQEQEQEQENKEESKVIIIDIF
jgi:hypothetical protein